MGRRRKGDEHSENVNKIQTLKIDASPGKAKAVRNSGKYRHRSGILPTPGFEKQRGGEEEGPYTRRLGKIHCSSPTQEPLAIPRLKSSSFKHK